MTQLILEAGADTLDALMVGTAKILAGKQYRIEVLPAQATQELQYGEFVGELRALAALFRGEAITSAIITPVERNWWVTLFCPMFDDEGIPWWSMAIECRTSATEQLFDALREVPAVKFVSLSLEEGLDFGGQNVDPSTFPWTDARLIRAAVHDIVTGLWVEKLGPASSVR